MQDCKQSFSFFMRATRVRERARTCREATRNNLPDLNSFVWVYHLRNKNPFFAFLHVCLTNKAFCTCFHYNKITVWTNLVGGIMLPFHWSQLHSTWRTCRTRVVFRFIGCVTSLLIIITIVRVLVNVLVDVVIVQDSPGCGHLRREFRTKLDPAAWARHPAPMTHWNVIKPWHS